MLEARFSYESLLAATDRDTTVQELEDVLARRLREASDPADEGHLIVDELRKLGHDDLCSFDESVDFQTWCGDWVTPKQSHELILEFRYAEDEEAAASVTFQERRKSDPK